MKVKIRCTWKRKRKHRNDTLWFRFYIRFCRYWRSMLLYIKYRNRAILPPGTYNVTVKEADTVLLPNGMLRSTIIWKDISTGAEHRYTYDMPESKHKHLYE